MWIYVERRPKLFPFYRPDAFKNKQGFIGTHI